MYKEIKVGEEEGREGGGGEGGWLWFKPKKQKISEITTLKLVKKIPNLRSYQFVFPSEGFR